MGYNNRNNGYIGFVSNTPVASTKAIPLSSVSRNNTSLLLRETTTNGQQNNTFVSEPVVTPSGVGYLAGQFSGSTDKLGISHNTALDLSTGSWTIEGWMYVTSGTYYRTMVAKRVASGATCEWEFGVSNSNTLYFYRTGTAVNGSTTVPSNTWVHAAVTYDGTNLRMFQNGTVVYTQSGLTAASGTNNVTVGNYGASGDQPWFGYLSNVRVIKGTAVYTAAFTPPTSPLTAISGTSLLTCQSGSGDTFADNSTNNFTITRTGTPTMTSVATTPPGAVPYAGSFNGSGQYLSVPDNAAFNYGAGDFTIESYVYLTAYATADSDGLYNAALVTQDQFSPVNSRGWLAYLRGTASSFTGIFFTGWSGGTATTVSGSFAFALNTWYHVAIVRSSNRIYFYVNGTLINAGGTAFAVTINDSSIAPKIGAAVIHNSLNFNWYLPAYLSNLRILKGTAVYTSNFAPPVAPLTAITNTSLLTCQSSTFIDNSPNNFTITNNGSTPVASSYILPTITRNGTPTQGSFSPYGDLWSNNFSGSGQYLTAPNNAALTFGTGDFTVEAWVNLNVLGSDRSVIDFRSSTNSFGALYISGSGNRVSFYDGTVTSSGTSLTAGTWNHVAWVRVGTTLYGYLNGVQQWSRTLSTDITTIVSPKIGADYSGSLSLMNGSISNLRVVKGTALYTSNFTPSSTPLTAVSGTSLLTCQSNRFRDNSSNNFAITVTGTPSVQRFSPFDPAAEYSTSVIGGSGYFSGAGTNLSSTFTPVTNQNFTFESWINVDSVSRFNYIFVQSDFTINNNTNLGFAFLTYNNTGYFLWNSGSTQYKVQSAAGTIKPNEWTHIACVRNGDTFTLYINGVNSASTTSAVTINSPSAAPKNYVGRVNNEGDTSALRGYISNLRLVIGTAVYTANFTPPTAPLTAITNTSLLLNCVNAGIYDNAMINNLVTVDNTQASTTQVKNSTSSLYFDGTNDYIYCTDSGQFDFGTGDFTVEAWIRPSSVSASINNIAGGLGPTNGDWMFALDSSTQLRWGRNHVAWDLTTSGVTFSANTWYHVAACRSGTSLRLFVDGIERAIATNSTAYNIANSFLAIGARQANSSSFGPGNFFNGYMEDFRIVKGFAVYTANFTPPSLPLTTTVTTSTFTFSDYYNTGILTNIENQIRFESNSVPGLAGKFFNGTNWRSVLSTGDIGTLPLTTTNDSSNVTGTTGLPSAAHRYGVNAFNYITYSSVGDNYGFIAIGYFKPPTTGSYTFYTSSDDYSGMWLGSIAMATSGRTAANALVNNGMGGSMGQGNTKVGGTITLYAGVWYPIRVVHEEGGGGDNLTLSWSGPGIAETTDLSQYFRTPSNGNILIGHYI